MHTRRDFISGLAQAAAALPVGSALAEAVSKAPDVNQRHSVWSQLVWQQAQRQMQDQQVGGVKMFARVLESLSIDSGGMPTLCYQIQSFTVSRLEGVQEFEDALESQLSKVQDVRFLDYLKSNELEYWLSNIRYDPVLMLDCDFNAELTSVLIEAEKARADYWRTQGRRVPTIGVRWIDRDTSRDTVSRSGSNEAQA